MSEVEKKTESEEADPEDVYEWTLGAIEENPEAFEYLAER